MVQLSHVPTPNGQAVRILLEELVDAGLIAEYQIVPPLRMAPSPEEWVPAIVDDRGSEDEEAAVVVFGSGYSLIYLGERFERFFGRG
jgi:glutathione S-transferase